MEYELITVKQLPALEEHFKEIGAEIDAKVTKCQNMVVTDANYKDIKKIRAELNKENQSYAADFKKVKAMVLSPWETVEAAYNENIRDKYRAADKELKLKIYDVEGELKAAKEAEIKAYYEEYAQSLHIDFVDWERTGIKVGLSDSKKSLKEKARKTLDDISADLAAIDALPFDDDYKLEVGAEYRMSLDLPRSMQKIADRHAQIEAEKKRAEERQRQLEIEKAHAEEVRKQMDEAAIEYPEPEILQPPVAEEPKLSNLDPAPETKYVVAFRVTCPESVKPQLVGALKSLKEAGCEFERLTV